MAVEEGQKWRSLGDGHTLVIVARARPAGWFVRIENSEVAIEIDEGDLLDPNMYQRAIE